MCRLFGLTSGTTPVRATFWLLDAPDSLEVQSHRNADGAGIGFFDAARAPVLDKQPEPAFADEEFNREARQAESATFVAHVRWATTGGRTIQNTHPFAMHGRIMAHNGGFGELPRLEEQLGPYASLVLGDTDSERYFALIIQQTEAHGGDVGRCATRLRMPCTSLSGRPGPLGWRLGPAVCTCAARPHRCMRPGWIQRRRWWWRPRRWTGRAAGACWSRASSCTSGPT